MRPMETNTVDAVPETREDSRQVKRAQQRAARKASKKYINETVRKLNKKRQ